MIKFFAWIKSNQAAIISSTVSLLLFIISQQCQVNKKLKEDLQITQSIAERNLENLNAIQDSVTIEKNSNNELVSRIRSLILNNKNLDERTKKIISEYEEVLNINTELQEINSAISGELKIKDSIVNTLTTINFENDEIKLDFKGEKKWDSNNIRIFSGDVLLGIKSDSIWLKESNFKINQAISLKAAIVRQDNFNLLKISTPNPDITFTTIENINLVNDLLNKPSESEVPILDETRWEFGLGLITQVRNNQLNNFETIPALNLNAIKPIGKSFEFMGNINYELGYLDKKIVFSPAVNIGLVWKPEWLKF